MSDASVTTYTDRNGVDWRLDEFIATAHPSTGALVESLWADLRDALADRRNVIAERDSLRSTCDELESDVATLRATLTTRSAEWQAEFKAQAATIVGLKASVKMHRERADDLDAELSAAEHRLTLVADARGHGL